MYIGQIRPRKICLGKCVKSCVSEDPSTENMASALNHCCILNDSTFTIFINHCESDYVGKNRF